MSKNVPRVKWIAAGVLFSVLWPSASTATKIGLTFAQPLVIAEFRFAVAAGCMLFFAHIIKKEPLPTLNQYKQLAVYGLLNITIYLGCYVVAMQTITAGIGALAVATNPVFISFLSVIFLKSKLNGGVIISLLMCSTGVLCAAWPLLADAIVTREGLFLLLFSMFCYSAAAIYFSLKKWHRLSLFTINGWQTFLGGLFLFPVAFFMYKPQTNHYNDIFWFSVLWLAIPVSIAAIQLWLWLLQTNALRAGLWLFLCPVWGFMISGWITGEHISGYTVSGMLIVLLGLVLTRYRKKKSDID